MNPLTTRSFDQLLQEGLTASGSGNTAKALELFAQAVTLVPRAAAPHFLMGSEYAALGNMAQAEECFARALLLDPNMVIVRYQLGLLQFSSSHVPQALLTWQPLMELPEEDALLHFVRGFTCLAADDVPEAMRHFAQGLALNAQFPPVFDDVRQVMAKLETLNAV